MKLWNSQTGMNEEAFVRINWMDDLNKKCDLDNEDQELYDKLRNGNSTFVNYQGEALEDYEA